MAGFLGLAVGLALTALTAAGDAAFTRADRVRLREAAGGRRGAALNRVLEHPGRNGAVLQGLSALGLMLSAAGAVLLVGLGGGILRLLLTGFLAALFTLAVAIYLPRARAEAEPERAAIALAPVVDLLVWTLGLPLHLLARLCGYQPLAYSRPIREDELRTLLDVDAESGETVIEEDEIEMMAGIMELGDTTVREIMVPRIDIIAVPLSATIEEALDTVIAAGHSRIPVYEDTIDNVVGLLYAKDLLEILRDQAQDRRTAIANYLRPPHVVPESMPVKALLAGFRSARVHLAVVVDEYGGTAGLVTIEDLLEQIVGDIQDEYDVEDPDVEQLTVDAGIFSGGMDVDDLNRILDIQLPSDDADTVGGLVLSCLGRLPQIGELARFPQAEIEVLSLEGRRIQRVRVSRLKGPERDGAEPAAE
jgi:CBS domain containing-hemolysin-like protein